MWMLTVVHLLKQCCWFACMLKLDLLIAQPVHSNVSIAKAFVACQLLKMQS